MMLKKRHKKDNIILKFIHLLPMKAINKQQHNSEFNGKSQITLLDYSTCALSAAAVANSSEQREQ
jgi:hypothetical protein